MTGRLLAALLASAPLPDAARALGVTQADWDTLAQGGVVNHVETERTHRGGTYAHAESAVLIHQPFGTCFDEVERYEGLAAYLPGMAESKVLSRTAGGFRAHAATQVLWLRYGYGLVFRVDRQKGDLAWELDKSQPADIADTQGAWRFVALDERTTLLRYTLRADSGSVLPQRIQNYMTERTLPGMLLAFRNHLERQRAL